MATTPAQTPVPTPAQTLAPVSYSILMKTEQHLTDTIDFITYYITHYMFHLTVPTSVPPIDVEERGIMDMVINMAKMFLCNSV